MKAAIPAANATRLIAVWMMPIVVKPSMVLSPLRIA
jgi:hypothetical protein